MATKLTITFEQYDDDGFESNGWPTTSVKTSVMRYPAGAVWTSFILDMAEACEGIGYVSVKKNIRFLGIVASDRDEEHMIEDSDD